ncbi:MAG: VTT domain-containing protein [Chlamydiales bacterium]|nr:VTT domain-containing protein [Chlamydiales bacterium]
MKAKTAKIYNWATEKASSSRSSAWVALLFALEIFLFIPLDAVLMFCCSQNKRKIFQYVTIAALASTLSGCIGYFLGHLLWDMIGSYIVPHLISPSAFEKISLHFEQYEHWAVFLGALLPFPLKALTLAAGVFHLPFFPFVCCLAAARLFRFAIVGSAMAFWGEQLKTFMDKHFHYVIVLIGIKILLGLFFFWVLAQ